MGMTLKLVNLPDESQVDLKKRVGRFSLSEIITGDANALGLTAYMLITAAVYNYYQRVFEYVAYSPLFDEIEEGEAIPEYSIEFQKCDDGIFVKALRQKR